MTVCSSAQMTGLFFRISCFFTSSPPFLSRWTRHTTTGPTRRLILAAGERSPRREAAHLEA